MTNKLEKDYESWFTKYKSSINLVERKMDYLAQHWFDHRDSAIPKDLELDTDSKIAIEILKRMTKELEAWVKSFKGLTQ